MLHILCNKKVFVSLQQNNGFMDKETKFKYQKQIDELLATGCQLPELFAPNNLEACRFVFSEEGHQNHIPQYMSNPKRMLQDINKGKGNTSLIFVMPVTYIINLSKPIPKPECLTEPNLRKFKYHQYSFSSNFNS